MIVHASLTPRECNINTHHDSPFLHHTTLPSLAPRCSWHYQQLHPISLLPPMITLLCLVWAVYSAAAPHNLDPSPNGSIDEYGATQLSDMTQTKTLWSLIWGCLTIIISCTWTSVHSNIPGPECGKRGIWFRRLQLCLIAILAPEWMVMLALRQRGHAKQLMRVYNETRDPGDKGK
jgi:hypothetical protein